jgi:hypothetical protein
MNFKAQPVQIRASGTTAHGSYLWMSGVSRRETNSALDVESANPAFSNRLP